MFILSSSFAPGMKSRAYTSQAKHWGDRRRTVRTPILQSTENQLATLTCGWTCSRIASKSPGP